MVSRVAPPVAMLESFEEFPPRAKAASFTVGDVMEKIQTASPQRN